MQLDSRHQQNDAQLDIMRKQIVTEIQELYTDIQGGKSDIETSMGALHQNRVDAQAWFLTELEKLEDQFNRRIEKDQDRTARLQEKMAA